MDLLLVISGSFQVIKDQVGLTLQMEEDIVEFTSASLVVDDDFAKNNYYYRCKLETPTSVQPSYTNTAILTVFRTITVTTQPTNQQPIAPAGATFTTAASTLDGATISYQWQKQEQGTSTFVDITNANSLSYTTGSTTYDNDFEFSTDAD